MKCSICRHSQAAEMIIDYAHTCSLRLTASRYNVGYRSLQRHIKKCVYALMREYEQQEYERKLSIIAGYLECYFEHQSRPRRRKSLISKKVEFTWSRRSWKNEHFARSLNDKRHK